MEDRNIRVNVTQKELDILNGNKKAIYNLFMCTFFHDKNIKPNHQERDVDLNTIKMAYTHVEDKFNNVPQFCIVIDEKESDY